MTTRTNSRPLGMAKATSEQLKCPPRERSVPHALNHVYPLTDRAPIVLELMPVLITRIPLEGTSALSPPTWAREPRR
ncbi:MAG: hypothetical protein NVSMB62_21550 [Acidobacteriaceae bacterium]